MTAPDTIRIVIPLTIKRRNGRPRILPPDDIDAAEARRQDPRTLRAIARAWNWRRRLEKGEATTLQDIAAIEKISDRFVSRMLRLAYLSPAVLEMLLVHRRPSALSINDLAAAAERPWSEQEKMVFEE
jgi:hypothetical protein